MPGAVFRKLTADPAGRFAADVFVEDFRLVHRRHERALPGRVKAQLEYGETILRLLRAHHAVETGCLVEYPFRNILIRIPLNGKLDMRFFGNHVTVVDTRP